MWRYGKVDRKTTMPFEKYAISVDVRAFANMDQAVMDVWLDNGVIENRFRDGISGICRTAGRNIHLAGFIVQGRVETRPNV
jgi:hypothetical protein